MVIIVSRFRHCLTEMLRNKTTFWLMILSGKGERSPTSKVSLKAAEPKWLEQRL